MSAHIQATVLQHGDATHAGILGELHITTVHDVLIVGIGLHGIGAGLDFAEVGEVGATGCTHQHIHGDAVVVIETRTIQVQCSIIVDGACIIAPAAVVYIKLGSVGASYLAARTNHKTALATEMVLGSVENDFATIGHNECDVIQTVGANQVYLTLDIQDDSIDNTIIAIGAECLSQLYVGWHAIVSHVAIIHWLSCCVVSRVLQAASSKHATYDVIVNDGVGLHLL